MSVRGHIILMLVATVAAWLAWLLVLLNIQPNTAQWWGVGMFYMTLFLALFGTFGFLGFVFRSIIQFRRRTLTYKITTSLRQSFLWTLALVIALALQAQRLLNSWIFIALIVVFLLIETFVLTLHRKSLD